MIGVSFVKKLCKCFVSKQPCWRRASLCPGGSGPLNVWITCSQVDFWSLETGDVFSVSENEECYTLTATEVSELPPGATTVTVEGLFVDCETCETAICPGSQTCNVCPDIIGVQISGSISLERVSNCSGEGCNNTPLTLNCSFSGGGVITRILPSQICSWSSSDQNPLFVSIDCGGCASASCLPQVALTVTAGAGVRCIGVGDPPQPQWQGRANIGVTGGCHTSGPACRYHISVSGDDDEQLEPYSTCPPAFSISLSRSGQPIGGPWSGTVQIG